MHKYKAGDVVQILDTKDNYDRHDNIPDIYPKPYTMGIVDYLDISPIMRITNLYIKYLGVSSAHNAWWHFGDCVRYVSRKELQAMIRYYNLYQKSTCFSVCDYYDKASTQKKLIEDTIKYRMEQCKGGDYRILGGNCHYFIAAFMAPGNVLYVATPTRNYVIDVDFIEKYLESTKNESRL